MQAASLVAQSYETIILKDGSKMSGYIRTQYPGKHMIFVAEHAELYIPSSIVNTISHHFYAKEDLPKEWMAWYEQHAKELKNSRQGGLTLSDIDLKSPIDSLDAQTSFIMTYDTHEARDWEKPLYSQSPTKVLLLEEGARYKYMDVFEKTYYVNYEHIASIQRSVRSSTMLSGIDDVIVLENGEQITGQIVGQSLMGDIRIQPHQGPIQKLSRSEMSAQKRVKVNAKQSLWAQSKYIDVITSTKGNVLRGVIVEQFYGSTTTPGYIRMEDKNGHVMQLNLSEIQSIGKKPNPDFAPIEDVIVGENEAYVNRQRVQPIEVMSHCRIKREVFAYRDEYGNHYRDITIDDAMVVAPNAAAIVLDIVAIDSKIILEVNGAISDLFVLAKLTPGKYRKLFKDETCGTMTYSELTDNSQEPINQEISSNNTLKLEFAVNSPGEYLLYNRRANFAVRCIIR